MCIIIKLIYCRLNLGLPQHEETRNWFQLPRNHQPVVKSAIIRCEEKRYPQYLGEDLRRRKVRQWMKVVSQV